MTTPDPDRLLLLADRAERNRLSATETGMLRLGIRQMADRAEQASRTAGGLSNRVRELEQKLRDAERDLLLTEPYRVTCPHCGAEPGQRCKAIRGATPPRTPHVARLDAARRGLKSGGVAL